MKNLIIEMNTTDEYTREWIKLQNNQQLGRLGKGNLSERRKGQKHKI